MKRISHLMIYFLVGVFSFVFFLYMLFPYASLKESVSLKLSASVGLAISIDDLGVKFPFGLAAYGVKVRAPNGKSLAVKSVSVRLSVLSLLMGRLGVFLNVSDARGGYLDLYTGF